MTDALTDSYKNPMWCSNIIHSNKFHTKNYKAQPRSDKAGVEV